MTTNKQNSDLYTIFQSTKKAVSELQICLTNVMLKTTTGITSFNLKQQLILQECPEMIVLASQSGKLHLCMQGS